jgi:hypothetical protein
MALHTLCGLFLIEPLGIGSLLLPATSQGFFTGAHWSLETASEKLYEWECVFEKLQLVESADNALPDRNPAGCAKLCAQPGKSSHTGQQVKGNQTENVADTPRVRHTG